MLLKLQCSCFLSWQLLDEVHHWVVPEKSRKKTPKRNELSLLIIARLLWFIPPPHFYHSTGQELSSAQSCPFSQYCENEKILQTKRKKSMKQSEKNE